MERVIEDIGEIASLGKKLYEKGEKTFVKEMKELGFSEEDALRLYKIEEMVHNPHKKVAERYPKDLVERFRLVYYYLTFLRSQGRISFHGNYTAGNELATTIYRNAYYLRALDGSYIEKHPEDLFLRVASFIAAAEKDVKSAFLWGEKFYRLMYEGILSPAGRIRAGAGDLYRLKTLSNCYFLQIEEDSIEGIWKTSYQMARTYSYGGGVGTDVTPLRPKNAPVHNASNTSTGPTSFMYLYSLTTGIIGQEGRRGALMITIDVKHPDILDFIRIKRDPDWLTNMIMDELRFSSSFTEEQLKEIEKAVINNVQVRFANISVKFTDEFFMALEEEDRYGPNKILLYERKDKEIIYDVYQDRDWHYSWGIPSKDPENYRLLKVYNTIEELQREGFDVTLEDLRDPMKRDIFGDYVIEKDGKLYAIRFSGDFLLYYGSPNVGTIKRLVKARTIWNAFVESNWRSAEPGLIFWSHMVKYSPSNYVGEPIMGTNPCGEVPLEHGGACVLSSLNLLSFVDDPLTESATFNWERFVDGVHTIVRFLDNVVEWNIYMHPLEDQREAMRRLRRIGAGIMGLADMLIAMGMDYDSNEALELVEKVMAVYANEAYRYSSLLAEEKGPFPKWNYTSYSQNPFFRDIIQDDVKISVKERGLRNVTLLAVAPTGNTSNSTRALELNGKIYVGVSSGIEPVFALYYTRRTEAVDNKTYRVFHPIAQAYIDLYDLVDKVSTATDEELKRILPAYFFRTAHVIDPMMRVKIQGLVQKYVDGSISSTVNLPEDIHPETVGRIYREAWRNRLKGITVYREGSRFEVLSVDGKETEFQKFKRKKFKIYDRDSVYILRGDEVIELPNGRLTTVYHAIKEGILRRRGS